METRIVPDELMQVKQLPVIAEQLILMKNKWQQKAEEALRMVCTEETIKNVKLCRSEMRKEFDELEERRKLVKRLVMEPYERFEQIYKDCVTESYKLADAAFSGKISAVESEMKQRCEDGLRVLFAELCAVEHLDWLEYERAEIKVDMASAKSKTPKRLQEQLRSFVSSVADDVNRIRNLDNADEIMVEFRESLDAADAICVAQRRQRRKEEEKKALEARDAAVRRDAETVRRVEALASPVVIETPEPEKIYSMDFRAHGTMGQLGALKKFAADNNIKLEVIKNE